MYKKRFLRLVSAVLALSMMAALLPTAAFATTAAGQTFAYTYTYDDAEGNPVSKTLKYTVNEDGKTVSVAKQEDVSGDVIIPETVKDGEGTEYTVTSIGNYAFSDCNALESITIPSAVTSIGSSAFHSCETLSSVTFESRLYPLSRTTSKMCPLLFRHRSFLLSPKIIQK